MPRRAALRRREARPGAGATLILEVAGTPIRAGDNTGFEAAVARGLETVLRHRPGVIAARLQRDIEALERDLRRVAWETPEAHLAGFGQSERFAQRRAIVGPQFAEPPRVEHFAQAAARAA